MNEVLRQEMLARAEAVVNSLTRWTHDHPEADLEAREEEVLAQGRRLLGGLLESVAQAAAPRTPGRCPECAVWAVQPAVRRRGRAVLSRCGLLRLAREVVTCRGCGARWAPLDRALGLRPYQRLTGGVRSWLVGLGTALPFRAAAHHLAELTGLAVGAETIRQHAEAVGSALGTEQQARIALVERTRESAEPVEAAPGQLVVETDGVMVHYRDGWHEVKLGLVGGMVDGELRAVSYVAAREAAAAFGPRLLAEAARRGVLTVVAWQGGRLGRALAVLREVAVLGDGARWIWNLAAEHFGARTEIVDFYHASEHVWALAKACYGEGSPKAARWAGRQLHRLKHRGPGPLLRALRVARPRTAAGRAALRRERAYFRANAARMDYPTYAARGLPLGSGAVESAARHLVQLRLKRTAAMRWSETGGGALLHLLAADASGRPVAPLIRSAPLFHGHRPRKAA